MWTGSTYLTPLHSIQEKERAMVILADPPNPFLRLCFVELVMNKVQLMKSRKVVKKSFS
jgi:hypothetical protein